MSRNAESAEKARSLHEGIKLPVGAVVFIREVSGVKLMVEEKEKER